eukprot:gene1251-2424_t
MPQKEQNKKILLRKPDLVMACKSNIFTATEASPGIDILSFKPAQSIKRLNATSSIIFPERAFLTMLTKSITPKPSSYESHNLSLISELNRKEFYLSGTRNTEHFLTTAMTLCDKHTAVKFSIDAGISQKSIVIEWATRSQLLLLEGVATQMCRPEYAFNFHRAKSHNISHVNARLHFNMHGKHHLNHCVFYSALFSKTNEDRTIICGQRDWNDDELEEVDDEEVEFDEPEDEEDEELDDEELEEDELDDDEDDDDEDRLFRFAFGSDDFEFEDDDDDDDDEEEELESLSDDESDEDESDDDESDDDEPEDEEIDCTSFFRFLPLVRLEPSNSVTLMHSSPGGKSKVNFCSLFDASICDRDSLCT